MRFWHRDRTDYFTQGITDGKNAAFHSRPTVGVDTAYVRERAQLAAAALPGPVAPAESRNYQSGWVEGYNSTRVRESQPAAADSMNRD
jgi:hypothetical protein